MRTKRDVMRKMARDYLIVRKNTRNVEDYELDIYMSEYDSAHDDAPRLEPGGQVNGEMVEAALDWAREQGRKEAQNHEQVADERDLTTQLDEARKKLETAQDKIEHLRKVVDEWRKTCDAIDRCSKGVQQRECGLRKELDASQRRIAQLEKELEQAKEVHLFNTVLRKDLDAAKRRIDEITKERDGVLRHNDELANERNAIDKMMANIQE